MPGKEETTAAIHCQNEILLLSQQHQRVANSLIDTKAIMLNIRQQTLSPPLQHSLYCIAAGVPIKQTPQQLYPTLEKEAGRLALVRRQLHGELLVEMRRLVQMMRAGKLGRGQLDS